MQQNAKAAWLLQRPEAIACKKWLVGEICGKFLVVLILDCAKAEWVTMQPTRPPCTSQLHTGRACAQPLRGA